MFNSLPLYILCLVPGTRFTTNDPGFRLLTAFAFGALLHIALDLPVHADDAHAHFWPISNWRFHSALSYWQVEHYGRWVGAVEIVLGLVCVALVSRRLHAVWVRAPCGLAALLDALHGAVIGGLLPLPSP